MQNQAAGIAKSEWRPVKWYNTGDSGVFQRIQVGFHGSVVDAQKFVGRSHHVNAIRLSFCTLFVHKLVHGLICRSILQINPHHQEKRSAQRGRPSFGDAATADIHLAGLVRWGVNTRKGDQRFLGMKAAHIANFSHKLGAEGWANTKHFHYNRRLRQIRRQGLHLLLKSD